jgi:hypothetical protein
MSRCSSKLSCGAEIMNITPRASGQQAQSVVLVVVPLAGARDFPRGHSRLECVNNVTVEIDSVGSEIRAAQWPTRAAMLDRLADDELQISHPHQAERRAYQAAELRDGSR